jgi:predicted methyltransferase
VVVMCKIARKPLVVALIGAVLFVGANALTVPPYVSAAIESPTRPERDKKRDADQKPTELLIFAGVKPGDRVADFWPAPPYSTGLLSLVVGDKGHVYGIVPSKLIAEVPEAKADLERATAPYQNVSLVVQPFDRFTVPEKLDVVWMGKIYHDFPNVAEMGTVDIAAVNRAVFNALKPGGVYIVIDHAATPGSGYLDTEPDMKKRVHRIDPEIVKRQVLAAGFVLDSESRVLANPNDHHDKSVFEATMTGKTDRFVFKFRKP